jgi:hypothetical protein
MQSGLLRILALEGVYGDTRRRALRHGQPGHVSTLYEVGRSVYHLAPWRTPCGDQQQQNRPHRHLRVVRALSNGN